MSGATGRRVGTLNRPCRPRGTVSVADKLVRFTRPGLTEEYSVSVDGVRQDFIESRPSTPTLNLGGQRGICAWSWR